MILDLKKTKIKKKFVSSPLTGQCPNFFLKIYKFRNPDGIFLQLNNRDSVYQLYQNVTLTLVLSSSRTNTKV